ncbi:MAG: preprotein translocase subunit SecG [Eubacteriales bacterium]|nr:preprotein translocase subunit SecG [Eubacteriales bacterium]MDN5364101.1 preprotein translocase subunit SecG [Eubacteriales bacterium]
MKAAVTVLHVLVSLILIASILLQSGRSAGLSGAIAGGAEIFFGKKKGIDQLLSRITTAAAVVFLLTSLGLAYLLS